MATSKSGIGSFEDMQRAVLQQAELIATGKERSHLSDHRQKLKQLIAAGTVVVEKKGIKWAQEHPEEFVQSTLSSLGFWLKLALFIGGLFIGGSSLWVLLAKFILPFVIDWFTKSSVSGVCGSGPNDDGVASLADGARAFLSGDTGFHNQHNEPLICK